MRFLANENFPESAVKALIASGHDVVWIRTAAPGMPDVGVLDWAARDRRVLLTFDKDFGELVRNTELPKSCGVILLRTPMPPAKEAGPRLAALITTRTDWQGHFSVVASNRVRMRKLST
ncbi:MAG TPA: DUF5615 family PIN-like protein [Propylenella sp.]